MLVDPNGWRKSRRPLRGRGNNVDYGITIFGMCGAFWFTAILCLGVILAAALCVIWGNDESCITQF